MKHWDWSFVERCYRYDCCTLLILSVLIILGLIACTVTPIIVHSPIASFDGTNQNSGFLGFSADGGCILTQHAKDRYDALVAKYGDKFTVPVKSGEGARATATNTWLLDPEHCQKFETMNRWRKQGL